MAWATGKTRMDLTTFTYIVVWLIGAMVGAFALWLIRDIFMRVPHKLLGQRPIYLKYGGISVVVEPGMCGCGRRVTDFRLDGGTYQVWSTCRECGHEQLVAHLLRKGEQL